VGFRACENAVEWGQILDLDGNRIPKVQQLAHRYTDRTIPALTFLDEKGYFVLHVEKEGEYLLM
jgi:hypothetical protein